MYFHYLKNFNEPDQYEFNADFSKSIVLTPDDMSWKATDIPGIEHILLENCKTPYARQTLLLRCSPDSFIEQANTQIEQEFFVLEGEIADNHGNYGIHTYVRNPNGCNRAHSELGCTLFVKLRQIHEQDQGQRIINTQVESSWLPGPESGISIFPLHVWDAESVLLMRWTVARKMKPAIDPQGEEILVISGMLKDKHRQYPTGSWIRNPLTTWQSWYGEAGTLIYYKNGHFPDQISEVKNLM